MTTIGKIPDKCKHGEAIHIAIDPPTNQIKLQLKESDKIFLDFTTQRELPELGFYMFRPRIRNDKNIVTQEQLKKGDIVTVTIKAAEAEALQDVEVT